MLTISYDRVTGIVHTVAQGYTSPEELDIYLAELMPLVLQARARHGRLLHLIDASNYGVQTKSAFEYLAGLAMEHGSDDDCNAIVMQSVLARMQLARMPVYRSINVFSEAREAEAWLIAQGRQPHPSRAL